MPRVLKWLKKLAIICGVLLVVVPLSLYFIVQLPAVQTFLVHTVTRSLQEQLPKSTISVGGIHYSLFKKLVVSDIYASDVQGDTLVYVKTAAVNFSYYKPSSRTLVFSAIRLYNGVFNLYDGEKTNNINEVLDELPQSTDTDTLDKGPGLKFQIKNIALENFRFTYQNRRNPTIDREPGVIDFKDLGLSDIDIDIRNFKIKQDTIFFDIKHIGLFEKSGYRIHNLSAQTAYISAHRIMLRDVVIADNYSYLSLKHYSMSFKSRYDFEDYPEKIIMSAEFNDAIFSLSTIKHFAPGFDVDNIKLHLNGRAGGTVNKLSGSSLSIALDSGKTTLLTSFKMNGLPEIDQTSLSLRIEELKSNSTDLSHILRNLIKEDYTPSTARLIGRLGEIHFKGSFDGLYNDFVAHGDLNTSIGEANVDMLFHKTDAKSFTGDGHAVVRNFNLGYFIDLKPLGLLSAEADAQLTFLTASNESFKFKVTGDVSKLEFNNYAYSNMEIDGLLSDRSFEGAVKSDDPNLKMDFSGKLSFSQGSDSTYVLSHKYRANIYHADLCALHFNTRDSISELKSEIAANYEYSKSIDGGAGRFEVSNTFYRDPSGIYNIGNIILSFAREENNYSSQLRSGFADANYSGPLPVTGFFEDLLHEIYLKRLPLLGDSSQHSVNRLAKYKFDVHFKRVNGLSNLITPGLMIGDQTRLAINLDPFGNMDFHLDSPVLALNDDYLQQIKISASGNKDSLALQLNINKSKFLGFGIDNIFSTIGVSDNNIETKLSYNNNSKPSNKGLLHINTSFAANKSPLSPIINFDIHQSSITVNDTVWTIAPAALSINERRLYFKNVSLFNQRQQIAIQGAISPAKTDTFAIRLNNFEVSNFNTFSQTQGYTLQGVVSGNAQLTGLYDTLMFYADFKGEKIIVNGRPLDHIDLNSRWDKESNQFRLLLNIGEKGAQKVRVAGIYSPRRDSLYANAAFDHFPLANVEPLLSGVLSDINGYLSGKIEIKGSLKAPQLYGNNVILDSLGLTVDYLKTHYTLTAPVDIRPNLIHINQATIYDGVGGKGTLSGTLKHRAFKDLKFDVNVVSNDLLCMNTTIKDNDLFYGKAYATGRVQITGDESNIHFDITAHTNPRTICYIPLSSSSQAKESGILTFKAPVNEEESSWKPSSKPKVKAGQRMTVDINLTATPEAEVQIIFDEKAGDIVRGHGKGNMRLSLDPSIDKFDLYGDYAIEQGDYFFTLQDIISKKFVIEQGSHISFNGDIHKTTLDITALYKTKTALNTLIADTSSTGNVRRVVDCRIHITGNLFNPALGYKVDVQNLDPSTRAQVEAALNTEEKMSRQFLSLLALNSFMPEEQSGISSINLSASASEMLSNQLSNMLTQLNIPFDVGFVYNTSPTTGQNDFDVAVSTQLFDNRLSINTAFGNAKNYNTNFTGDVDIELKLDKQGRYRAKAFTHSADQFTDQLDNSQRSGLGFIYQEDFNTFKELFNRWFGRKKKDKKD